MLYSGLKALCTFEAAAGLEECRKCLGGHGGMMINGDGILFVFHQFGHLLNNH